MDIKLKEMATLYVEKQTQNEEGDSPMIDDKQLIKDIKQTISSGEILTTMQIVSDSLFQQIIK